MALFEIDNDSKVKGSGEGYWYCCTIPPHKYGERRKDRDKKYIYLHRAVMEKHLGRYLKHDEQVDHKDGDKSNNALSNLELTSRGEHQKDHTTRGNHFWTKSPKNKKKRKKHASEMAPTVVQLYLQSFCNNL